MIRGAMRIEVWSDVVCPWCYLGRHRLERALAGYEQRAAVEVVWRAFELDPGAPREEEGSVDEILAAKYGGADEARAMMARVTAIAAEENLEIRLDRARRGSTFDAHRLIRFARRFDLQDAMVGRLMRAYFVEGAAIGDPEALAGLASDVGLPSAETYAVLRSDAFAEAVRGDEADAERLGIRGVPCLVIDRSRALTGARPAEEILRALRRGAV